MNLIDCSYFYTGPLAIENAKAHGDMDNNAYAVQEAITGYIEHYQDEFLRNMVGDALAETVVKHLADTEAFEQALAEAEDGEEVVPYVNKPLEELCGKLRPSYAHYVYFKIAGDANQTMTATGLVALKSANAYQVPRQRMVKVWNDMVELNKGFVAWAEKSDYEVYYQVEMVTPVNQFNL